MAITARITKSGQVTIPAEIRRKLELKPGDTVIWEVNERGRGEVQPVRYTIDELDGILPRIPGDDDLDQMVRDAFEQGAEQIWRDNLGCDE